MQNKDTVENVEAEIKHLKNVLNTYGEILNSLASKIKSMLESIDD